MKIHSIQIRFYQANEFCFYTDLLLHKKSLPYLSIVQALEGEYGIRLDQSPEYKTGEGGIFLAPAQKMQEITHYQNNKTNRMCAQWLFLEAIVNELYPIDDLYDFPVLFPAQWQGEMTSCIQTVLHSPDICQQYMSLYRIIQLLLSIGTEKTKTEESIALVLSYIHQHYQEHFSVEQLASLANLSLPSFCRKFKKETGCSACEYINNYRLSQASLLLERTDNSIAQIAETVGIPDQFYFSRLFKRRYGSAPLWFRSHFQNSQAKGN